MTCSLLPLCDCRVNRDRRKIRADFDHIRNSPGYVMASIRWPPGFHRDTSLDVAFNVGASSQNHAIFGAYSARVQITNKIVECLRSCRDHSPHIAYAGDSLVSSVFICTDETSCESVLHVAVTFCTLGDTPAPDA